MSKVLGLDLGKNSIGWAILDTEKEKIIDMGSRIFRNPIDEINVNGKILQQKSIRRKKQTLRRLGKVYKFVQTNTIILTFFFLQIITLSLLLINIHDWQFWFSLFFTVPVALLSIINEGGK